MATCLQQQTEWITDAIAAVRARGASTIEPTAAGEQAWVDHHEEVVSTNLISKTSGWYLGTNVPGKPRRVLSYTGGVGTYRQKCADEAAADYPGFLIK
jgi:cyclohexanone monooxygenase/acetone monooxygenase